jgi:hypothetical protein
VKKGTKQAMIVSNVLWTENLAIWLIKHGADIYLEDKRTFSPFDLALPWFQKDMKTVASDVDVTKRYSVCEQTQTVFSLHKSAAPPKEPKFGARPREEKVGANHREERFRARTKDEKYGADPSFGAATSFSKVEQKIVAGKQVAAVPLKESMVYGGESVAVAPPRVFNNVKGAGAGEVSYHQRHKSIQEQLPRGMRLGKMPASGGTNERTDKGKVETGQFAKKRTELLEKMREVDARDKDVAAVIAMDELKCRAAPAAVVAPRRDGCCVDYTALAGRLDAALERLDAEGALRSAVLSAGKVWSRQKQAGLGGPATTTRLQDGEQRQEKQACFDLIDSLTRSGSVSLEGAEMHIVMSVVHCFDRNVMDTLCRDNINPIEKVERSSAVLAGCVFGTQK